MGLHEKSVSFSVFLDILISGDSRLRLWKKNWTVCGHCMNLDLMSQTTTFYLKAGFNSLHQFVNLFDVSAFEARKQTLSLIGICMQVC